MRVSIHIAGGAAVAQDFGGESALNVVFLPVLQAVRVYGVRQLALAVVIKFSTPAVWRDDFF